MHIHDRLMVEGESNQHRLLERKSQASEGCQLTQTCHATPRAERLYVYKVSNQWICLLVARAMR